MHAVFAFCICICGKIMRDCKGVILWHRVFNASAKPEGVIISQFEFLVPNLVTDISKSKHAEKL